MMAEGKKMSRRDWFRLVPRRTESETLEGAAPSETARAAVTSMGTSPHGLQTIPHPENHDGMDLAKLPPMREALLTEEQIRQLFADIETLATDVLLMQRLAGSARALASTVSTAELLRTALESLLSGATPRLQIRYHWQAFHWIDTLQRHDAGIRLIRIAHDLNSLASRPAAIGP
jgi:hypothetical protein